MTPDAVTLAHRWHLVEATRHLVETARGAGATDGQVKAALVALRGEGVEILHDEEAEALLARLELREV